MPVVPFLDLPQQHRPLEGEIHKTLAALIAQARFIGGQPVADFERAFAEYCQSEACVGVANGTDALMLALRVLGVKRGDVVLVPAHTFIATAEAVSMLGATPRFVDIDAQTYTLSPAALAAADWRGVKAVIPVHLYGQPADLEPILKLARAHGAAVLEDAAQAHGATYRGRRVGSLADLAAFSFYPGKNLGAFGDAGAVVGADRARLDELRRLADHGRQSKYLHGDIGVNSRLDALQAAVLSIKLRHLNDWNARRARAAAWYDTRLKAVKGVITPALGAERTHIYHLYVVQVMERDALVKKLEAAGIGCGVHYQLPVHLQPAYRELGYEPGSLPVSESVAARCLSLPMFPDLTEAQVDQVVAVVERHARAGS